MEESLECRVFRKNYESLQKGIRHALGHMVQAAYTNGLIPEDTLNVAGDTSSTVSQDSRTRTFLNAVQDGIKMESNKIYKFIEILQQEQFTKTLADQLTEALQKEPEIMAQEKEQQQHKLILGFQNTSSQNVPGLTSTSSVSPSQSRPITLPYIPGDQLITSPSSLSSLLAGINRTPVQHPTALNIPIYRNRSDNSVATNATALLSLTSTHRGASYSSPAHYAASFTSPPMKFDEAIKNREISPTPFNLSGNRKTSLQSVPSLPPSRNHSGILMMHPLHPESILSESATSRLPPRDLEHTQHHHQGKEHMCSSSETRQQTNEPMTRQNIECDGSDKQIATNSEDHHVNDDQNVSSSAPKKTSSSSHDQVENKSEHFSHKVDDMIQNFEAVKLHDDSKPWNSNIQGHFIPENPKPKTDRDTTPILRPAAATVTVDIATIIKSDGLSGSISDDSDLEQESQEEPSNLDVPDLSSRRRSVKSMFSQDSVESSVSSVYETPLCSFQDDYDATKPEGDVAPVQESHDSLTNDYQGHDHCTKFTTERGAAFQSSVQRSGADSDAEKQICTKCVKYKKEIKALNGKITSLKRSLSETAAIQEHQVNQYNKRLFVTEQEKFALNKKVEDQNERHIKAETEIATLRNQTEQLTTTVVLMNERLERNQSELQQVKAEAYDHIKQIEFLKLQLEQVKFMQCAEQSAVAHGPYS